MHRSICSAAAASLVLLAAACSTDAPSSPSSESAIVSGVGAGSSATGDAVLAATLRLRCEVRQGRRSKISVDGSNLVPLNATWSARVASAGNRASAPAASAIGDEVEFDFDSNPADIRAGATPIARTFIVVNASGPDVTAQILDAAGSVVASGTADCRVR